MKKIFFITLLFSIGYMIGQSSEPCSCDRVKLNKFFRLIAEKKVNSPEADAYLYAKIMKTNFSDKSADDKTKEYNSLFSQAICVGMRPYNVLMPSNNLKAPSHPESGRKFFSIMQYALESNNISLVRLALKQGRFWPESKIQNLTFNCYESPIFYARSPEMLNELKGYADFNDTSKHGNTLYHEHLRNPIMLRWLAKNTKLM